jgi:hypothetical protein
MGKILDITERIKHKDSVHHSASTDLPKSNGSENVVIANITEARQEMIRKERREAKRTILSEFIGAFVVLPERGLLKVSLYDISEYGLAFDTDMNQGSFTNGEEVAMRVYMNKSTYFPFNVRVNNGRLIEEEGIVRHGATIAEGSVNDIALGHFIRFIETVSADLRKDHGDVMVWNIS